MDQSRLDGPIKIESIVSIKELSHPFGGNYFDMILISNELPSR